MIVEQKQLKCNERLGRRNSAMARYIRVPAIVFCYLTVGCRLGSGLVGTLHGSVELPCEHHHLPGPLEKINVYWQRKNPEKALVVATVINGKVDVEFVDVKFRGRAHLNPDWLQAGNFNLSLTNLSLYDSGTYDCIVLWSPSYVSIFNNTTVELKVTAEFSTPVVHNNPSPGKLQFGQERSLTCTSQGGLEQPRIMWINASDHREVKDGHIHETVHQEEDIINVTNTITLNITSDINIFCVIVTKNRNVTSQLFKMEVTEEPSSPHTLIVVLLIGAIVGAVLTVILVKWRHIQRPPTYRVTSTEMPEL